MRRKYWPLAFSLSSGAMTLVFYVLIVHRYGVGKSSDLVFALSLLPNVLYTVTFGQLNEILVPYFVSRERPELAATAFWNVAAAVAVIGTVFGGTIFLPMTSLAPVLFHAATENLPPGVIRNLLLSAVAYNLIISLLVVKNSYLVSVGCASLMQFVMTAGNAVSVAWLWQFGQAEYPLQILGAQIVGAGFALLCPVAGTKFSGYLPGHWREHLSEAFERVRWLVVSASVTRTEPLFDSIIAGFLGTGAITIYYLFQRVVGFSHAVVQNGYILPFTKEASELARHNPSELRRAVSKGAVESSGATLVLLLASALGFALMQLLPLPALQAYAAVYQQHAAVFFLLFGYGVFTLTTKTYATGLYVMRNERLFTIVSVVIFLVGMGAKILAAGRWGLPGLALGSSLASVSYAGVLALVFLYASGKRLAVFSVSQPLPQDLGTVPE